VGHHIGCLWIATASYRKVIRLFDARTGFRFLSLPFSGKRMSVLFRSSQKEAANEVITVRFQQNLSRKVPSEGVVRLGIFWEGSKATVKSQILSIVSHGCTVLIESPVSPRSFHFGTSDSCLITDRRDPPMGLSAVPLSPSTGRQHSNGGRMDMAGSRRQHASRPASTGKREAPRQKRHQIWEQIWSASRASGPCAASAPSVHG
jgi:hypothetical protein